MLNNALHKRVGWGEYMEDDGAYTTRGSGVDEGPEDRGTIVDLQRLGRMIRGRRVDSGLSNDEQFSAAVERTTDVKITPNVLYNIQTGRKDPTWEQVVAIVTTLRVRGGMHYLLEAFDPKVAKLMRRLDESYVEPVEIED